MKTNNSICLGEPRHYIRQVECEPYLPQVSQPHFGVAQKIPNVYRGMEDLYSLRISRTQHTVYNLLKNAMLYKSLHIYQSLLHFL